MRLFGLRVPVIIGTFIVALALLYGVRQIYDMLNYQKPLLRNLQALPYVSGVRVENRPEELRIWIAMKQVDDLPAAYHQLQETIRQVVGRRNFQLELEDNRNPLLVSAYKEMQFALYEAAVRGNLREASTEVERITNLYRIKGQLAVDREYIYLQLTDTDNNHYLYFVLRHRLFA